MVLTALSQCCRRTDYDFGVDEPFTPEDLKAIKKEMERIVREGQRFTRRVVTEDEARAELAVHGRADSRENGHATESTVKSVCVDRATS